MEDKMSVGCAKWKNLGSLSLEKIANQMMNVLSLWLRDLSQRLKPQKINLIRTNYVL